MKQRFFMNEAIKQYCNFVRIQGHAKINAYSYAEMELFNQKYGRRPEIVEIWDYDEDIKNAAKKIVDQYYNNLNL